MKGSIVRHLRLIFALALLAATAATASAQQSFDVLIRGGRVIDGSGNPWFPADVGIRGGKIVAVGDLSASSASRTIDATHKYVVPGFIDLHSHGSDSGRRDLNDDDP